MATRRAKRLLALLAAMVVLGSGVAYAANRYPESKCGDPVDRDDSALVEGLLPWRGDDADEQRDADGWGKWSCINEKP